MGGKCAVCTTIARPVMLSRTLLVPHAGPVAGCLKSVLFGPENGRDQVPPAPSGNPLNSEVTHVVIGTVLDVSPHVLVLQTAAGEERLTLAASTAAWRGGAVPPAALKQGDKAIVKRNYSRATVADRIWAEIGRVTGTIVERDAGTLLVDEGTEKGRKILVIPPRAAGRIQVRFPRLQPGYLIDVIGLRRPGFVEGVIPATSQPPYRADHPPSPPMVSGHIPASISGTATWHEAGEEPEDLLGVAYPALDPETGCEGHDRARPGDSAASPARAAWAPGRTADGIPVWPTARPFPACTVKRRMWRPPLVITRATVAATYGTRNATRLTRIWPARAVSACPTCRSEASCGSATTAGSACGTSR